MDRVLLLRKYLMLLIQHHSCAHVQHSNVLGLSSSCRATVRTGEEQNSSTNELKIHPKTFSVDMHRNEVQVKLIYG